MTNNKKNANTKRAILVLGPHRSGTSLIANSLDAAGFQLGNDPLEPNEENPRGFFESKKMVAFNDRLLAKLDLCWDCIGVFGMRKAVRSLYSSRELQQQARDILQSAFNDDDRIAIKDPRLCILEPFWAQVLAQNGYGISRVLVLRHPLESALSQVARYNAEQSIHVVGKSVAEGVQLWASYLLAALGNLRTKRPYLVDHANVMRSPDEEISSLRAVLDIPEHASTGAGHDIADQGLRRNEASSMPSSSEATFRGYIQTYSRLSKAASTRRSVGTAQLGCAYGMLRLAMSRDKDLPITQRRLYARARNQAVGRGVQLHAAQDELIRSGNIIRFNEHLIQKLKKELKESGSKNAE